MSSSSWIRKPWASACTISERMEGVLGCDGLLMLHRSKWRCLASTYSAEIQDLIELVGPHFGKRLDAPLQALQQALQDGEACMQASIPRSSDGNYHSWLVDALKLCMSTDVVDVHLHNFLWASSVVRERVFKITGRGEGIKEAHMLDQARKLNNIWSKEDADDDLHTAKSFLMKLKAEYRDNGETWQLVDFILHKLSHVEEAPHNHVTPGNSLPPYMCIHSDECKQTNTGFVRIHEHTELREVEWLGARFVLKSFNHMDEYDYLFNKEAKIDDSFNKEAAIQARVWHPHLVPLVCCTKEPPGLLMEHLQEDLHALIKRRRKDSANDSPFPLFVAVDLMLQIAKGMEYLHSDTLRIIHRDLKPANILVRFPVNSDAGDSNHASTSVMPQVHLKIADFGISKAKHDFSLYTTKDQGTVSWMAPEVYRVRASGSDIGPKYSNKADVYSFGIVCYEILTGKAPLKGRYDTMREKVLQGERPPLPQNCPPALSSFIRMCWHADPTQRPTFIQICRMLRYFKACILLHDGDGAGLVGPLISPNICAHIDDMIEHSFAGGTFQPKALGIPLEMFFCGVQLQNFGFPSIHNVAAIVWDCDRVYTLFIGKTFKSGLKSILETYNKGDRKVFYEDIINGIQIATREMRMCASGGRGSRSWPFVELPPHLKQLRRFTFKELSIATAYFSTLMFKSGSDVGKSIANVYYGKSLVNVYLGELEHGQEVAVASVLHSGRTDMEKLWFSMDFIPRFSFSSNAFLSRIGSVMQQLRKPTQLLGWCLGQDALFMVFPCHAKKIHLEIN